MLLLATPPFSFIFINQINLKNGGKENSVREEGKWWGVMMQSERESNKDGGYKKTQKGKMVIC